MLDVPVYNMQGEQTGTLQVDAALLGGEVRPKLLHQAIVMYEANARQGSAATKNKSMVAGSTRKLYKQKGTGNARVGQIRTPQRRGGGRAFRKGLTVFERGMNKKMRRLARDNAILAKITSQDALVIDGLSFSEPKTKPFAAMLTAVGASRGAVVALEERNNVIYRSGRNIPKTDILAVNELNAYDILRRRKLIFTRPAWDHLVGALPPKRASAKAGA
ncbi:MAG TPA: 50S ribosomal protein L4 [Phycisphaerae bacterium]|jgi:large subunit ribosomal protein L4